MDTGVGPDCDVDLEAWDAQNMGAVVFRFLDRQLCLNKNIKKKDLIVPIKLPSDDSNRSLKINDTTTTQMWIVRSCNNSRA